MAYLHIIFTYKYHDNRIMAFFIPLYIVVLLRPMFDLDIDQIGWISFLVTVEHEKRVYSQKVIRGYKNMCVYNIYK